MRFKEVKRLIQEDSAEDLFEINMSPGNLAKLSSQIDALAGMEFEMIVPDVSGDDEDDFEPQPDYDQDQRARTIDDIVAFFDEGGQNSSQRINRLRISLETSFEDWFNETKRERWSENAMEYVSEWIWNSYKSKFLEDAKEQVIEEYGDTLAPEEFDRMVTALATDLHSQLTEIAMNDMDANYDEAFDEWSEEFDDERGNLESEWLEHEGLETMRDVEENYNNIEWPHWTEYEGNGDADIEATADSFSRAVKKRVNWSSSYHGARRDSDRYVVEPDSSLDPDDSTDYGLEFVSPPMTVEEMFKDLDNVKRWADDNNCYTNESTGLHINISIPNYDIKNLDYVKLALLMGDQYVLTEFERMGNRYARSAMEIIKDRIKQKPEAAAMLLGALKGKLDSLATKIIHNGSTDKYTSINAKSGYIEFRSPGGDWLSESFFSKIKPTLMRFVVALDAAMDPEKYREEYLKKLYTLLQPKSKDDTLAYFARYAAGQLPKSALKSFIKQAQLERKVAKEPADGQKYWWSVSRPGYFASIEVVATSKEEAIDKAIEPGNYPDWANARNTLEAKPIKPYDESPVRARVGEPQAVGRSSGPMLGDRPSNPDGNWVIQPENDRSVVAYRFSAADRDDAALVTRQWRQAHPDRIWIAQRDDNRTLGQPGGALQAPNPGRRAMPNMGTQQEMERRLGWPDQTGDANYEIVRRDNMTTVFVFIANTDQDAARKYGLWLAAAGYPQETENFGFRRIDSSQQREFGQRAYYVIRNIDRGYNTASIEADTQDQAIRQFRQRIANDRDSFELLDSNGRTITTSTDQRSQAQQRPLSTGREFAGWKVLLPSGEEVYRFSGVGNNQGDANRIAAEWLRNNGMGVSGEGFEVVPIWREA